MRDQKEALRRQVEYLEDTLAEKDAEIARLRGEKRSEKREKKKREIPDPPELRFGHRLADGSVRFVVRPVDKIWVWVMIAVALGLGGFLAFGQARPASWVGLLIWVVLPLAPTFRAGFDLNLERKTVCAWQSWAGIRYTQVRLLRLVPPDLRTISRLGRGIDSKQRVTMLYWGDRYIPATLPKSTLTELVAEAGQLIESAG